MKVAILTYAFPPSNYPVAPRMEMLYQELKLRNYKVKVITTDDYRYNNDIKNIEFNSDIKKIKLSKTFFGLRVLGFAKYFFMSIYNILIFKPNLVICSSGRLGSLIIVYLIFKIFRIDYAVDYRDIFSSNFSNFFIKNNYLKIFFNNFLLNIEKRVFKNARHVNVVSKGMYKYYKLLGFDVKTWSIITNGFNKLNFKQRIVTKNYNNKKYNIIYAGNIGLGQGFKKNIFKIGKKLDKSKFNLKIYGSGSEFNSVRKIINDNNFNHIKLYQAENNEKIKEILSRADLLYFQLSDNSTVDYAIPSKIFEYILYNKLIIGLINKTNHSQIKEISSNLLLFSHSDINKMLLYINNFQFEKRPIKRQNLSRYSLKALMKQYVDIVVNDDAIC